MSARMTLSELPLAYQKQAAAQLSPRGDATTGTASIGDGIRAASDVTGAAQARRLAKEARPRLRQHAGDGLNKTERAFMEYMKRHGFELLPHAFKIRLANGCYYTPDFICFTSDCTSDFIYFPGDESSVAIAFEVKGFMRDDAAVKLKVAASIYRRIKFCLATPRNRSLRAFRIEEVHP